MKIEGILVSNTKRKRNCWSKVTRKVSSSSSWQSGKLVAPYTRKGKRIIELTYVLKTMSIRVTPDFV